MSRGARLHFVYNVEATPWALARDFWHRLVSPETYPCRLCDLTYGRLVKKSEWRRAVRKLGVPARFHTRGRFVRRYPDHAGDSFPAVYLEQDGKLRPLIGARELARVPDLAALEKLLAERLAAAAGP